MTLRYRGRSTLMPTVSAAAGCSPTARTRSPHRVLEQADLDHQRSATYVEVEEDVRVESTGPMSGMSASTGIFDRAERWRGCCTSSASGRMTRS